MTESDTTVLAMQAMFKEFMVAMQAMVEQQCKSIQTLVDQQTQLLQMNATRITELAAEVKSLRQGQPADKVPGAPTGTRVASINFPPLIHQARVLNTEVHEKHTAEMERQQRAEKANNAVVVNWPEANPPLSVSTDERGDVATNHELATVRQMVDDEGGQADSVTEVFRMGDTRKDGSSRPVKVKTNNAWTKRLLLRKGNELAQLIGGAPKLYVRPDLTDNQRYLVSCARDALEVVRKVETGKNLVLRDFSNDYSNPCVYEKSGKNVTFAFNPFDIGVINKYKIKFCDPNERSRGRRGRDRK